MFVIWCSKQADELTLSQVEKFYESQAKDDEELPGVEGVDLSSHLDVFYAILKQVGYSSHLFHFLMKLAIPQYTHFLNYCSMQHNNKL